MLLMRGFDSVAHTLSLLSNNLDNALQVCSFTTVNFGKRVYFGYYVVLANDLGILSMTNTELNLFIF